MASKRQSYHATVRALQRFDMTYREAQRAWRFLKAHFERSPRATDLTKHPTITRRAVSEGKAKPPRRPVPPSVQTTPTEFEEWEITIRYQETGTLKRSHITIRLTGPKGATNEIVRRTFFRAINGHPLTFWTVRGVHWEQVSKRGHETEYDYGVADIATQQFRALYMRAHVRVALVED